QQIWQLVTFVRALPRVASTTAAADSNRHDGSAGGVAVSYVGSHACQACHTGIYQRWSKTRMANVILDPKQHPEAVLGDFSQSDPAKTFTLDDVAFVYGSKWKQRYFKKVGDDYFPLGAQWDVTHKQWRPYHVAQGTDWWVPYYGNDNL